MPGGRVPAALLPVGRPLGLEPLIVRLVLVITAAVGALVIRHVRENLEVVVPAHRLRLVECQTERSGAQELDQVALP
jgi:hypothetical protein